MSPYQMIEFFIQNPKAAWIAISLLWLLGMLIAVIVAHFSKRQKFNVVDLLFYGANGKLSDSKARLNGAFIVTTWAFVWLTLIDKLTEWYVAAFLTAWVIDRISSRNSKSKLTLTDNINNNMLNEDQS